MTERTSRGLRELDRPLDALVITQGRGRAQPEGGPATVWWNARLVDAGQRRQMNLEADRTVANQVDRRAAFGRSASEEERAGLVVARVIDQEPAVGEKGAVAGRTEADQVRAILKRAQCRRDLPSRQPAPDIVGSDATHTAEHLTTSQRDRQAVA